MFSPHDLLPYLTQVSIQHVYIGYSGGLDSHVLLHALATLKKQYSLPFMTAIHINHGLSPNAKEWELHCEAICKDLQIPFQSFSVSIIPTQKQSLEEAAREARYQIFSKLMKPNEALFTAHQKEDQAETILYRLCRGTGLKGLSGMSIMKPFNNGYLFRPLLNTSRHALEIYAKAQGLKWIEDESNQDTRFDRNFIRHAVLPVLETRWPSVKNHLTRVSDFSSQAQSILEEVADTDKNQCEGSVANTLSIQKLLTLSPERQMNVLRYWFQMLNLILPSQRRLQQMMTNVIQSSADSMAEVSWGTMTLRRHQDNLYILPINPDQEIGWQSEWDLQKSLSLPQDLGVLTAEVTQGGGLLLPPNAKVVVRFRQGGERCHPAGRQGSHPLKKCFQEWRVPQWERSKIPLIYYNDVLVAVVGYCICEPYQASSSQQSFLLKIRNLATNCASISSRS